MMNLYTIPWFFMLVFLFIFCHLFQSTLSISSNDSADFDADDFLNLPSGQLLQYPTTPQSENREVTSKKNNYIRPRLAQEAGIKAPVSSKEKKSRSEYKRIHRLRNPILQKQQQKRDYEGKKKLISKMNEEEHTQYIECRKKEAKYQYQMRTLKRGYGSKQNEKFKEIRRKVKENIASKEEIEALDKLNLQKLKKYHAAKAKRIAPKG